MAKTAPTPKVNNDDVDKNKVLAIIAYFGILCLVPYLTAKDSAYAQYHARQGFNLLVLWAGSAFIFWAIPVLGWLVGSAGYLLVMVLFVIGIINASSGQSKPLPVIGGWQFLK